MHVKRLHSREDDVPAERATMTTCEMITCDNTNSISFYHFTLYILFFFFPTHILLRRASFELHACKPAHGGVHSHPRRGSRI
jgi:hypothetical protein